MSTNDEPETTVEEVSTDAVADLAAAKANAESTKPEAEGTAQVPNTETAEVKEEAQAEPETTLTKEPDHDLEWYKTAYDNSTKEALRLKGELDKKVESPTPPAVITLPVDDGVLTPELLYIRGKQIEESDAAFAQIREKYPALEDKSTYDKFVNESRALGAFIVQDQKRFPSPSELYEKTAVILGLQPDNTEAIGSALKDTAASPRTASATPAPAAQSKVSEDVIALNLKMYPGKTRQEIIEELEPHIN